MKITVEITLNEHDIDILTNRKHAGEQDLSGVVKRALENYIVSSDEKRALKSNVTVTVI